MRPIATSWKEAPLSQLLLLVEDDPVQREALADLLTEEGYEVYPVDRGQAALRQLEQEPPDLILLDMILPDLDGFALLAALHNRGWSFPVLAMTASSNAYERARRLLGFRYCLPKPLDEARLLARIRLLLAEEPVS